MGELVTYKYGDKLHINVANLAEFNRIMNRTQKQFNVLGNLIHELADFQNKTIQLDDTIIKEIQSYLLTEGLEGCPPNSFILCIDTSFVLEI